MTTDPAPRRLLTVRQRQVMVLVANGYTNTRIGRELRIGQGTVRSAIRLACRNLGADSRGHAAVLALRYEEITLADVRVPDVRPVGTLKMVDQPRAGVGS